MGVALFIAKILLTIPNLSQSSILDSVSNLILCQTRGDILTDVTGLLSSSSNNAEANSGWNQPKYYRLTPGNPSSIITKFLCSLCFLVDSREQRPTGFLPSCTVSCFRTVKWCSIGPDPIFWQFFKLILSSHTVIYLFDIKICTSLCDRPSTNLHTHRSTSSFYNNVDKEVGPNNEFKTGDSWNYTLEKGQ